AHEEIKRNLDNMVHGLPKPALYVEISEAKKLLEEYEERGENAELEKAQQEKRKIKKGFEQLLKLYVSKIEEDTMKEDFAPVFRILKDMDIQE
ncbi:hypothetical protein R0K17_22715, partial [Planococcus sp. SIMBA_143]